MNKRLTSIIFLIITLLLFSTYEITCKLVGTNLHPLQISFLRFLIGGLVLLPIAIFRIIHNKTDITKRAIINMIILGFVNIVVSMEFFQFGLLYANASTCSIIFASNPIFVCIFAAILLREKITFTKFIGILIGLAGVFVILANGTISMSSKSNFGSLLVLIASVFFGLYTVLGKKLTISDIDTLTITSFSFIAGSILLLPFMLVMKVPIFFVEIDMIPYVLYLGVVLSGIAYVCYFYGLSNVNTSAGSMIYFVKPIIVAIISVKVLHESLNKNFFIGTFIIILGLIIVNLKFILICKDKHLKKVNSR